MNHEFKMVMFIQMILLIIYTYMVFYNENQLDLFDKSFYLCVLINGMLLYYIKDEKIDKDKWTFFKNIYHYIFTIYLIVAPLFVKTMFGMMIYIILTSITIGSWIFRKNGCFITSMKRNDNDPTQKHFVRNGFIKDLHLDYVIVFGGIFYVAWKMMNLAKDQKVYFSPKFGGGKFLNFSKTSSGKSDSPTMLVPSELLVA